MKFPRTEPEEWPLVSVVIPCLNEERYIGSVLSSLGNQDYPGGRFEVLVADGMSGDGTRKIVRTHMSRDPRIRIIDNPDVSKPAALNRGIAAARGSIFVRMDAHADYPPDYLRLCVHNLLCTDADNVGGTLAVEPSADTLIGRAIAVSVSSWFGTGGSKFRSGAPTRQWVDTVFCGTYRMKTFREIGLFDERLLRGQDREFNERLRRAGGRILYVPEIQSTYYARSSLRAFVRWIFAGGATPFLISHIAGYRIWSLRNLVPPAFALFLFVTPVLAFLDPLVIVVWLAGVLGYLIAAVGFSIFESAREGDLRMALPLAVVYGLTHVVYGMGAIKGVLSRERYTHPVVRGL